MNAYELADFIDKYCVDNTSKEAATMLRQQADRIAELEKELEITSKAAMDLREIHVNQIAELEKDLHMVQRHYDSLDSSLKVNQECSSMEMNKPAAYWDGKHFASKEKSSLADIPVYTHQHKELSDEEIKVIATQNREDLTVPAYLSYARAIIKASRGEE